MFSQENLKNLSVLVTRPRPQGQILCEQIQAQGGKAIYLPTIDIQPPHNVDEFQQKIASLDQFDWAIFISPQAVLQSIAWIHACWPSLPMNLKLAAIGAGTALTMQEANLPVDVYPKEDWRSEGLLKLSTFQAIQGQKIAIIGGEGGRDWLEKELGVRGAKVSKMVAYRRTLPSGDMRYYLDLLQANLIDIIVCTSLEGLQNLKTLLEPIWSILKTIPILVISLRLADLAQNLGFERIFVAKNASLDAILEAIIKYRNNL